MITGLAVDRLEDNCSKPVSKYKYFLEASIQMPVIFLAAHNWTFSKKSISDGKHILKSVSSKVKFRFLRNPTFLIRCTCCFVWLESHFYKIGTNKPQV